MKKLFSGGFNKTAVLAIIFVLLILVPAARMYPAAQCFAAQIDPFGKIAMSADTELFDSTDDQGLNGQPVQYVEEFGVGYSYAGDCVILRDLDFSGREAKAISVLMANGDNETLNLSVHLNDMDSKSIAVINVSPTGGYTREKAKMFCADFDFPIEETATVYIKWLDRTGNMFEAEFFDEYLDREGRDKNEKANQDNFPPPTGDNIYVFAILTLAAAFAVVAVYKKYKSLNNFKVSK